jgi:3-phenylpropionate/trans-cinnamate dioxygenase ferredoxin component
MYNYKELEIDQCEYIVIAPASELDNGERIFVEIDELSIVIFNIGGELFAIGDVCSHDNGPVGEGDIEDNQIICPRHGARFNIKTGKALTLPAVVDIPAYPVRIIDGQIEVGVPREG